MLKNQGRGSYVMEVRFHGGQPTNITVDSGAEESVCPREWGAQFGIHQGAGKLELCLASGAKIIHYGERRVFVDTPF